MTEFSSGLTDTLAPLALEARGRGETCSDAERGGACVRMLRGAGTILLLLLSLVSASHADEVARYDLASISLQPAYVSASQLRASSGLHAVAFSPADPQAPAPVRSVAYNEPPPVSSTIGIAVGDAGTILRSSDGGESWWPIESLRISDQSPPATQQAPNFFGMGNRSRGGSVSKTIPPPFCEFSDVLWLSPQDVVVVGGGYEPVTGISRGACVISHDMGETFQLADAHELPRLRTVKVAERGSLVATGDASEASGVNRFGSYDGGRTWVEDILPRPASSPARVAGEARTIITGRGTVSINDVCRAPDGSQFAVASHGRIFRLAPGESQWQAVRGGGRQTGVLFVAAAASQVPWSLVGRESLQENRRVTIVLDAASLNDKTLDRLRAAAAMFGVADVLTTHTGPQRDELLREQRPAVVALDDSLPLATRESWLAQIEGLRTRAFASLPAADSNDWQGPHRVVLTRPLGTQTDPNWQHSGWQRAWNHASVLRSTALLTGPGVLAHDLTYDALMLVAPGYLPKPGVEVATLDDSSGSVRRDVSLSAGLNLTAGQNREEAEASTASHRRLQITTARMNQTTRLIEELRSAAAARTPAEAQRLGQQIEHLLAITAPEDRTRLLWEAYTEVSHAPQELAAAQALLLKLLARQASPPSIGRWASLVTKAVSASVERQSQRPSFQFDRQTVADPAAAAPRLSGEEPHPTAQHGQPAATSGQAISPFQIAPVSYESEALPAPRILVPQAKQTVWQSTPGLHALRPPAPAAAASDEDPESPPAPARINWDYHPVVMAARGVEPTTIKTSTGKATPEKDVDRQHQSRRTSAFTPPSTATRPLLDGADDDRCWQQAEVWKSPGITTRCVADDDYLYFAITVDRRSGLCLSLDCDGDYFTSLQFEVQPDGTRRVSLNGKREISMVWYAAISAESDASQHTTAEFAIARSNLPAPLCRVRASRIGADDAASWEVMPDASLWHPSRQSVAGRQY